MRVDFVADVVVAVAAVVRRVSRVILPSTLAISNQCVLSSPLWDQLNMR